MSTPAGLQVLESHMQPQVTEVVRFYANLGAAVSLEAETIEDKYNYASMFRVASALKDAPQDRAVIAPLDQKLTSSGSLKLFALDNATIASSVVQDAAQKRIYVENSEALVKAIIGYESAVAANNPEEAKKAVDGAVALLTSLNKNGILISDADAQQGITPEVLVSAAIRYMEAQIDTANLVLANMRAAGMSDADIEQNIRKVTERMSKQADASAKQIPGYGIAQKAALASFPVEGVEGDARMIGVILGAYLNDQTLETNHGMEFSNLKQLNDFLGMLHPELSHF
jgi:hypothetical protein